MGKVLRRNIKKKAIYTETKFSRTSVMKLGLSVTTSNLQIQEEFKYTTLD